MADSTTFEAASYTAQGTARERVPLPAAVFDGTVNVPVMHQAVKAYLANQRLGNAKTKTRKYVTGGNQKPWKQKGTGRARQGSTRAPHWVGGGTVFGPIPRSYAQYVPRQVRALARKSAFNARAREGSILIIDRFEFDAPRTARLKALVDALGAADKKVLILTHGANTNLFLSGRNLPSVHVMPYSDVSTYHLLWSDIVLIESAALGQPLAPMDEAEAAPARRSPRASKAASGTEQAPRSAAKKPAGKRAAASAAAEGDDATTAKAAKRGSSTKPAAKRAPSGDAKKKGK